MRPSSDWSVATKDKANRRQEIRASLQAVIGATVLVTNISFNLLFGQGALGSSGRPLLPPIPLRLAATG